MLRIAYYAGLITALVLISGCGGRPPNPVSQYQPGDEERSCTGLAAEISDNEKEMALLSPHENAAGKNVVLGAAGVLFIVPWFFMDFKEGEATDLQALSRRNRWLREVAVDNGCDIPPPKYLVDGRPCSSAENPDMPWIGSWSTRSGGDLLAVDLTQDQISGQLINYEGTFDIDGRVDEQGVVEASFRSSWAIGSLTGEFPDLVARVDGRKGIGSMSPGSQTPFVLCQK
jgi:hypothetical protein